MIIQFLGVLLGKTWELMTTINIPSTSFSVASVLIGAFVAVLSLKIVGYMMQFSFHGNFKQVCTVVQAYRNKGKEK